jgi:hypothetical protein
VPVFNCVALLEFPFERLKHHSIDAPVFITANAAGDFRALNPHVQDHSDFFVIASEIT